MSLVSTFSVVAYDAASRSWGVAVQSRFSFVGSVVPWAQSEVGAIATQSIVNPRYGPIGLAMLKQGLAATDVVNGLIGSDPDYDQRQLGIVDGEGRAAAFTGAGCIPWAGHRTGESFVCLGNILAGAAVLDEMVGVMQQRGDLPFPDRLIASLVAGQAAGGDLRGQQAAALLVVRHEGGFAGLTDRLYDLRVDDHPAPITELSRLLQIHRETFGE